MALNTPQFGIPTSLVFTPRDYAKDMVARQEADKTAVQNLFKFGTQVYDYLQGRKQSDIMEKDSKHKQIVQEQLQADMNELAELKKQLAALGGA
jgi:hypothetical protein